METKSANYQDVIGTLPQEYEEVRIPMPWGHVAGKWYGLRSIQPIICLHGWQDNSGSFDTLIPILPKHVGYLSLDLPGHGLSSWLPSGMSYSSQINLIMLRIIMLEYNWEKISIIGHSTSSSVAFLFAGIFPDKVDLIIGLDTLKPHISPIHLLPQIWALNVEEFLRNDEESRNPSFEQPAYLLDELIEMIHSSSGGSVEKTKCHYLIPRNTKKSSKYPDKYFFSIDNRLQFYDQFMGTQGILMEYAKRIAVPHLVIKATDSPYREDKKYFDEMLEQLQHNSKFEFHTVKGSHHVHLNNPERIADILSVFINKYCPTESSCNL